MNRRGFLSLFALPAIPIGFVVTALSTPALTLSEIVQATLRANMGKLAANVTANNAILFYLQKNNKVT